MTLPSVALQGDSRQGAGSRNAARSLAGSTPACSTRRAPRGPGAVLRGGAVLAFARLVDLVGALARPLAAGAGAVPGDESARLVHPRRLPALARRLRPPGGERQAEAEAEAVSIRAGAAADRAPVSGADFAALLPDVARRLLGDPPRARADEWRYGSLSVHPQRGTLARLRVVEHVLQTDRAGALAWAWSTSA